MEELIYKFRYDQNTNKVQLMSTVDTRPVGGGRSGSPTTVQYQYFDPSGKRLNVRRNFDGQYVPGDNEVMDYYAGNFFGSIYIGNMNPKRPSGAADYRREPQDLADAAALIHDQMYDKLTAAGWEGAVIKKSTRLADEALAASSALTIDMRLKGLLDPYTGKAVSQSTVGRASIVEPTFAALARSKAAREPVENGMEGAMRMAGDGIGNVMNSIFDAATKGLKESQRLVEEGERLIMQGAKR